MSSLKDIAIKAGLTVSTVSDIMKNRDGYSETTRKRVREIAAELNYRPNAMARAIRQGATGQIGVIIPNGALVANRFHNIMAYEMLLGINDIFSPLQYTVTLINVDKFSGIDYRHRIFSEHMFDGVIIVDCVPDDFAGSPFFDKVIWLESNYFANFNCIRRDEFNAGRHAAMYLKKMQCDRFIWCSPTEAGRRFEHYSVNERKNGAGEVFGHEPLSLGLNWFGWNRAQSDWSERRKRETDALLAAVRSGGSHTGVVAYSHFIAQWIFLTLSKNGLQMGRDFHLVSCDEVESFWDESGVPHVRFNRYELGQQAAKMLSDLIGNGKNVKSEVYEAGPVEI